jgi:hypothetical protein
LPPTPDPRGIARPSEAIAGTRSRYSVHGLRHAVSTASRFSGYSPSGAEAPEASMDFGFPSGHTETIPPEPHGTGDPHGVLRLHSDISTEIHQPGLPHPVRSAYRVSHPLDGLLPPCLPTTRIGATHEVHPPEPFPPAEPYAFRRQCPLAVSGMACSCSEDQEVTMPRGSRALLPAEIRTPASRSSPKPMLSWAFLPLQSVPRLPWVRLPGPFLPALFTPALREVGRAALQGLTARSSRTAPRRTVRLS